MSPLRVVESTLPGFAIIYLWRRISQSEYKHIRKPGPDIHDIEKSGSEQYAETALVAEGFAMGRRWSQDVTRKSNALDLEPGVFTWDDPRRIARSLQRSAETSARRKSSPYHSAMSMLTFYINRAGNKLPPDQRKVLEQAKAELRSLYQAS